MKRPSARVSETTVEQTADIDSLRRGLEVLRCFKLRKKTLTLGEIVNQTGIPRLTALKLLNTLIAHHFVRFLSDPGRYEPDVACFVLGHSLLASLPVVRAARPLMKELSEKFKVDVLLAFRDNAEMMIAECCTNSAEANEFGVGDTMPLGTSAAGYAWLWSQKASTQGKYLERMRADAGEGGRSAMLAIYRAFQEVEERGYCLSVGERIHESQTIATPLVIGATEDVFVLACVTIKNEFAERFLRDEVAPGMLEAAARIIKELSATERS